ncbi:MAG: CHAD domain-containing protein [Kiritimatiellales bacterium]|jgi:CHAD domain-containing protein
MNSASPHVATYLLGKTRLVFGTGRAPRRPGDAKSIHRMRVASRRLRVGFRFFGALFPDGELREILLQLQRVTQALGDVRTLDVNARLLRQTKRADALTLIPTLLAERTARADNAGVLLEALRADQFPARVRTLIRDQRRPLSDAQLHDAAADRLCALHGTVRKRFDRYRANGSPRAFHRLRIAAKKYRYALEASQAVFPESATERIAEVAKMQDLLGRCHDLEAVMDWLSGVRGKKPAQHAATLLDVFAEKYERRRADAEKFLKTSRQFLKGAARSKSGR